MPPPTTARSGRRVGRLIGVWRHAGWVSGLVSSCPDCGMETNVRRPRPTLRRCLCYPFLAALRRNSPPQRGVPPPPRTIPHSASLFPVNLLSQLRQRRLIVVTGKGGVGKSAVTAALGRILAAAGRRSLVLEVDPRENLHQLLGVPPSGGEVVEVVKDLYLQNLKPEDVVDWVVRKQVKIEMIVERVQKSPVYHRFVEGAPGLEEMAILGHALRLVRGDLGKKTPDVDTVILDAPATGHGVYLLTASRLFADAIGEGPFAELAREVADFTADADECGVVVVTLAEEMPVQEALELRDALDERFGRLPELLVVNGLYPRPPEEADEPPESPEDLDELLDLWRHRRRVNDVELARLEREWGGPRVHLPLLPVDRGAELVASLDDLLAEGLEDLRTERREAAE